MGVIITRVIAILLQLQFSPVLAGPPTSWEIGLSDLLEIPRGGKYGQSLTNPMASASVSPLLQWSTSWVRKELSDRLLLERQGQEVISLATQ